MANNYGWFNKYHGMLAEGLSIEMSKTPENTVLATFTRGQNIYRLGYNLADYKVENEADRRVKADIKYVNNIFDTRYV